MRVSHVEQNIEAVAASETGARQLRVEEGFPLLMITRIIYREEDGMPVQFSQDLLRSDYTRIHSELK